MSSFDFREAVRRDVAMLILLAGGTGSGKTESALRIATGLANGGLIVGLDTENGRMLHKADDYKFQHAELGEPFSPERYAEGIHEAEKLNPAVLVIDSGSHEYDGIGGVLDSQIAEFERMGRKESARMASWIDPKRRHKLYVRALLRAKPHVIVCHRAEDKIDIVKDAEGKTRIVPKASLVGADGWVPICERRLPFEATISLLLTAANPGVPIPIKLERRHADLVPLDAPLSEDVGRKLAEWAAGASAPADAEPAGEFAGEHQIPEFLDLAARVSPEAHEKAVAGLAREREAHGGRVRSAWLGRQSGLLLAKVAA